MDSTKWSLLWLLAAVAVVSLIVAIRLLVKLVRSWRLVKSSGIPMSTKTMFWASVAYLIWPVDLLPDPIYIDDVGFLLLALRSLHAAAARYGVSRTGKDLGPKSLK
ncbi:MULTISPECIES: YkvA family protein [unclassified Streptomyces]|uniref:YkvA family protein n=1 Tax=unclassified Streptomyces TaxID=2593676 RepID=UPI002E34B2C1|nr:YkvA family protein [Streptomyces sp. NBC_01477]